MPAAMSLSAFRRRRAAFDDAAARTPDVDRYCSSSAWALAAHAHLSPGGEAREVVAIEQDDAWVLVTRSADEPRWRPPETVWGLGCPVVGPEPAAGAALLRQAWEESDAAAAWLAAIPAAGALRAALGREFRGYGLKSWPGTAGAQADLAAGFDAWLRARGRGFRRSLLRSAGRAAAAGVVLGPLGPGEGPAGTLARILAVEARTARGSSGLGVFQDPAYRAFYEALFVDAAAGGRLRTAFAHRSGEDLAYYVGVRFGASLRGLQMGYDDGARSLGVGAALHMEVVRGAAAEGVAAYDLGMALPYKRHWSDRTNATLQVLVRR